MKYTLQGAADTPSRILVAVDGSACAKKAFEAAMNMAGAGTKATLCVMAAVQPLELIGVRKDVKSSLEALIEKDNRALLKVYEEIAKEARGLIAKTVLVKAHPAKAILDVAKSEGADLIVVGSRGLGGVKGLFLGSVSNAVVQNSKVPVMVVK